MTKEEAKTKYPNWNPRYIAFCVAIGETPEQREERSKKDGCSYMYEFLMWMAPKVGAFEKTFTTTDPIKKRWVICASSFPDEFDDYLFSFTK